MLNKRLKRGFLKNSGDVLLKLLNFLGNSRKPPPYSNKSDDFLYCKNCTHLLLAEILELKSSVSDDNEVCKCLIITRINI